MSEPTHRIDPLAADGASLHPSRNALHEHIEQLTAAPAADHDANAAAPETQAAAEQNASDTAMPLKEILQSQFGGSIGVMMAAFANHNPYDPESPFGESLRRGIDSYDGAGQTRRARATELVRGGPDAQQEPQSGDLVRDGLMATQLGASASSGAGGASANGPARSSQPSATAGLTAAWAAAGPSMASAAPSSGQAAAGAVSSRAEVAADLAQRVRDHLETLASAPEATIHSALERLEATYGKALGRLIAAMGGLPGEPLEQQNALVRALAADAAGGGQAMQELAGTRPELLEVFLMTSQSPDIQQFLREGYAGLSKLATENARANRAAADATTDSQATFQSVNEKEAEATRHEAAERKKRLAKLLADRGRLVIPMLQPDKPAAQPGDHPEPQQEQVEPVKPAEDGKIPHR